MGDIKIITFIGKMDFIDENGYFEETYFLQ